MQPISEQCYRYFAEIIRTLKGTNQYEGVLSLIVDRIVRATGCQTCAVVLIDPQTEYLHIDNAHNLSLTFCNSFRRRIATAAVGELLWTGKPVVIPDSSLNTPLAAEIQLEHPFASCICVQIAADQRTLGYLHVDSQTLSAFGAADAEHLQMFADIAGLALAKAQLYEENLRLDRMDRETGLEKYVPFLERLRAGMGRAEEFSENFAVIILDIDNFKSTVNTYGYDTSRVLLKEMGTLVKSSLRPIDAAGRYGFDEFIVMLANTGLEGSIEFANHLRSLIAAQHFTQHALASTVSIGVAAFPRNGTSPDTLILTAKNALFEAQRSGRNAVFSYKNEWYARAAEREGA
jgi:diguanylate cyclase (GGDEF)-like protein